MNQSRHDPAIIDQMTASQVIPDHPVANHSGAASSTIAAATLGSAAFRLRHGVRLAYMAGSMAAGIAGEPLLEALVKAGCLASFGAAGLPLARLRAAIVHLRHALPGSRLCFNLIHMPDHPAQERAVVELYLEHRIETIEASAFMQLTAALVLFRARGAKLDPDGRAQPRQRIIAKVSRREVAQAFLMPAPESLLANLLAEGALSDSEADAARRLPMADDITVEADSGGHTDRQSLICAWPALAALRSRVAREFPPAGAVGLGAGGGIGTPAAMAAAFAMGADYVVTGSINQACVEASTSPAVKDLLAGAEPADTTMAPAADMFELGISVQVLKRGSMFALRANQLGELYRAHDSLAQLPPTERTRLEQQIFRQPLAEVEAQTLAFWQARHPALAERAVREPRVLMGLVFRWYLGQASRWAIEGAPERALDYQIWCGPAMGAFNAWAADMPFAAPARRHAAVIATTLMAEAARQLGGLASQHAAGTSSVAAAGPAPADLAEPPGDPADLQDWLVERIAEELGVDAEAIDPRRSFESYRLDSVRALALLSQLEQRLSLRLSPTLVWNYPTIEKLAERLRQLTAADTVEASA